MIGKTVWRFDPNYWVYAKDGFGRSVGGPIYREYWRPITVFGETSRSWLAGFSSNPSNPYKIPKNGPHRGFALSEQEVDDDCWIHSYRSGIARSIEAVRDAETLRKIADLTGWKP
jgi:hypothetical protein